MSDNEEVVAPLIDSGSSRSRPKCTLLLPTLAAAGVVALALCLLAIASPASRSSRFRPSAVTKLLFDGNSGPISAGRNINVVQSGTNIGEETVNKVPAGAADDQVNDHASGFQETEDGGANADSGGSAGVAPEPTSEPMSAPTPTEAGDGEAAGDQVKGDTTDSHDTVVNNIGTVNDDVANGRVVGMDQKKKPTGVVESAAAPAPEPAPAAAAEKPKVDCLERGVLYVPINMVGQGRSSEATANDCQLRCQFIEGCKHFGYWTDGGCHIQDANAIATGATEVSPSVQSPPEIAGPPDCDTLVAAAEKTEDAVMDKMAG